MKLRYITAVLMAACSAPAMADSGFDTLQTLTQAEFSALAKDLNAAASYKAAAPAEALGVTGFDIGLGLSSTQIGNSTAWKRAGGEHSFIPMPKLHLHKGLPFNVDVGASLSMVPGTDIKLMGAEIKYAFVEGGAALPAVAVRAAVTKLAGVDELDLDTRSLELTVSKGFINFTPYAGVGRVWGSINPNVAKLAKESPTATKVFAGLNVNLGLANLLAEADRTGKDTTVSIKVGLRF